MNEALRLAEFLEMHWCNVDMPEAKAAAELRRLHAENESLRQIVHDFPPVEAELREVSDRAHRLEAQRDAAGGVERSSCFHGGPRGAVCTSTRRHQGGGRREGMKTDLGVTDEHVSAMQMKIDALERANDWIGNTPVRHAISERLVEIRLLLRDGHLKNKNGGKNV